MHPVINIALRAARSAAEQIAHVSDRLDRVNVVEDHGGNLVTSMDLDAERTILYHLRKAYPDFSVESRISGYTEGADRANTWLIDPIVGNRNFYRGVGAFCVSVALRTSKGITQGVLVNPATNQEFTASKGDGAQLNATRIRVGKASELEQSMIALDGDPQGETVIMQKLLASLQALPAWVQISGCPALDMAHVASGRLDAAWCAQQPETAIAAARLILLESGALLGDPQGNPQVQQSKELLFSNPKCFKQLLKIRQTLTS
ncbi:MAG TPA: inositol monophosphatase [Pseudohongiella sp.]|nr:inositol monophosphatase [Pseudohongiella sp.]MAY55991.1 inositol monophosphatase [Gammaproteobacteria bacterium]MEC8859936.1 inositol monophosphatase family protein [Pseudomonadota bacterium]MAO41324.1 inositol monophosphatase [Pseudohongiella sp.]MBJ53751.1 inositol monophosphatase [Gammaproteobacteria bacterium]|tara:strand:+ start:426 stop:1208 length:783 start_codon:yes stop_codon:yes gene_type:complete